MTDSSLCIILVSIHWKIANESSHSHKAGTMTAIVAANPENNTKSLYLLVPHGLFYGQVALGLGTRSSMRQWVSLKTWYRRPGVNSSARCACHHQTESIPVTNSRFRRGQDRVLSGSNRPYGKREVPIKPFGRM